MKDCRDPWTQVTIAANGDVMPCCHSFQRMGTLAERPLEEIWNGPGFVAFRRFLLSRTPLPVCEQCFVRGWRRAPRRSLGRVLRRLVDGAAVLLRLSEGREVVPSIRLNAPELSQSDDIRVSIGLRVGNTARCLRVALFVFAEAPGGERFWVHFNGRWPMVVSEPGPTLPSIEPFSFDGLEVLRMPLASVPPGLYTLRAVTTLPGADPLQPASRLGAATAMLSVAARPAKPGGQRPRSPAPAPIRISR